MKLALTPLNVTAMALLKFVPLIVTLVPTGPLVGVKLVIVGGGEGLPFSTRRRPVECQRVLPSLA